MTRAVAALSFKAVLSRFSLEFLNFLEDSEQSYSRISDMNLCS